MSTQLSRRTMRYSWPAYTGAFVALLFGVLLIAVTVSLVGSVDATANQPGVTDAERTQLGDLSSLFGIMSGVSLFMALFVVGSTFGFVVATRHRELGLIRLLGATPWQVRRMVLAESAVVAVAAVVAGCLLGTVLAPGLPTLLRGLHVTSLRLRMPTPWLAWAVAAPAGLTVALLGAWRSARRAARIAPVAALREAAVARRRPTVTQLVIGTSCLLTLPAAGVLAHGLPPLFALLAGVLLPEVLVIGVMCFGTALFPWLAGLLARPFTARHVAAHLAAQDLRASARTTAALAAPIVAISAIAGSLLVTLSFTADWTVAQDRAQLAAPLVVEPGHPAATRAVTTDPSVAVVDARRQLTGEAAGGRPDDADALAGEDIDVVDVPAATAARGLRAVRGSLADLRGETIAISETLVTDSGLKLGDTVRGRLAGRDVALRLVAIVPDAPDLYGERLVPADLFTGGLPDPDLLFVLPRPGVSADAARASLTGTLADTDSRVLTADAWIDEVDAATRAANNYGIVVLLGPAGMYAAIAIVNATLIGAGQRRRQRELIELLGATEAQQRRLAVWAAGLVGAAALLIGAFTTGFLGWLIRQATARDLADAHPGAHVSAAMSIPWLPLVAVAATCGALAVAAALAGTQRIRRGEP